MTLGAGIGMASIWAAAAFICWVAREKFNPIDFIWVMWWALIATALVF